MKKQFLFIAALAMLFTLVGCNKGEPLPSYSPAEVTVKDVDITTTHPEQTDSLPTGEGHELPEPITADSVLKYFEVFYKAPVVYGNSADTSTATADLKNNNGIISVEVSYNTYHEIGLQYPLTEINNEWKNNVLSVISHYVGTIVETQKQDFDRAVELALAEKDTLIYLSSFSSTYFNIGIQSSEENIFILMS